MTDTIPGTTGLSEADMVKAWEQAQRFSNMVSSIVTVMASMPDYASFRQAYLDSRTRLDAARAEEAAAVALAEAAKNNAVAAESEAAQRISNAQLSARDAKKDASSLLDAATNQANRTIAQAQTDARDIIAAASLDANKQSQAAKNALAFVNAQITDANFELKTIKDRQPVEAAKVDAFRAQLAALKTSLAKLG